MSKPADKPIVPSKIAVHLGRDLTRGNILKNLLFISWPILISNFLVMIGPVIDMVWMGKLGSASVAGVAVSAMLVTLLDSLKLGLDMGTRVMIANFIGAGDTRQANHVALQGYVVTIGFAAIVGTTGAVLAGPILKLMGLAPEVVTQGAPYLRIQFIGILTNGLLWQNSGTMQYSGDTMSPMKITIAYRLLHIVLSPFLVFGWWLFPQLGTRGAAYTSIISGSFGAILGLWFLFGGHTRLKLSFKDFRLDGKMIWRIVKIGVPASITGIERSLGQLMLTWFIVPFGTVATAAHALILQITQLLNITGSALGQGSAVLAGQNLGAQQPQQAEKSGWLSVGLFTSLVIVFSLVLWFWGKNILGIFNKEPDVLATGVLFLRIQIVTYMFSGCTLVLQPCLNGVGDTLAVMLVTLLAMLVVQLPLAFLLSQHTGLGVYGTYWAIAIGTIVMAALYGTYFRIGLWKRKRL
jgi:putative MATE family efflux protein